MEFKFIVALTLSIIISTSISILLIFIKDKIEINAIEKYKEQQKKLG